MSDLRLAEIFSDGMVLQANKPIRLYGTGSGKIVVSFLNETKEYISDSDEWCFEISERQYGGPYSMELCIDGVKIIINNIMIGEVLLCAGQSNMELQLKETNTSKNLYDDDNLLRIYSAETVYNKESGINDRWVMASKQNLENWSALGYLIGRLYRQKYDCAVGIALCACGSSIIQSWINKKYYIGSKLELPIEQLHRNYKAEGGYWNEPGYLYDNALKKYMPYSFSAAVWYQGESNAGRIEGAIFSKLISMFCDSLRKDDKDEELPICIVQIADCFIKEFYIDETAWKMIQEEQKKAVETIKIACLVESRDICENDNIHPKTKTKLAERIFANLEKIK